MSGSAYVVMPVGVGQDGTPASRQETARMASAIQNSVYEQTHPKPPALPAPPKPEEKGPLKEMLAHQDSLYEYISWEDPIRTVGSYVFILSLLTGFHFMPLTLWALKAGAYTFGAVSVAEFVSRSFGPDTFLSRLRPQPYRKVPERILNATLKDIHDFTQYSVVQGQKIMFGQDLDKTFAAFLGCTALYWLIQIASPFALSVGALTMLYMAPLAISPQGRELANAVAHDTTVLAGDVTNKAMDTGKSAIDSGKSLANSAMNKGQSLANTTVDSGKSAIDSGKSLASSAMDKGQSLTNTTVDSGKSFANSAMNKGQSMASTTVDSSKSAIDTGRSLANQGLARASEQTSKARETVVDTSSRVGTAASNMTGIGRQESKNELEDESHYVFDHKPASPHHSNPSFIPSSIPRASHRTSHTSEPSTKEEGRKTHVYSDPMSSRS